MNTKYWFNTFEEIIQNGIQESDDIYPRFKAFPIYTDFRGTIEILVPSIKQAIYFIENIIAKGWVASNVYLKDRGFIGVSFDSKGDDFEGIRVLIPCEYLKGWCYRYNDGKNLSENQTLKEVIDKIFDEDDKENFLDKLKSAKKVENDLYHKRIEVNNNG